MEVPKDPRYPNRPTHPDFAKLMQEAQANDNLSELGQEMWEAMVGNFVDLESLSYMVMNRALMFCQAKGIAPTMKNVAEFSAAMVDGFMLGAGFERRRAEASD